MDTHDYTRDVKVPNNGKMRNKWYNQVVTHTKPGKVRHVEIKHGELTNKEFLRIRKARIRATKTKTKP